MAKGKVSIDQRVREEHGEIRTRSRDTVVGDLRATYGPNFAVGYRSNMKVSRLSKEKGYESLSDYLNKSMSVRTYTAVIHREGRWYVAACPEVGVVSQGKSIDEAIANLKEATELYLEEFPPPSSERSLITTFDVTHA
jgi:predicted RNase H-like HicB family nuclease